MPNPSAPRPMLEEWEKFREHVAATLRAATHAQLSGDIYNVARVDTLREILSFMPDRRTYCREPNCGARVTQDQTWRDTLGDLCDQHASEMAYQNRMAQGE